MDEGIRGGIGMDEDTLIEQVVILISMYDPNGTIWPGWKQYDVNLKCYNCPPELEDNVTMNERYEGEYSIQQAQCNRCGEFIDLKRKRNGLVIPILYDMGEVNDILKHMASIALGEPISIKKTSTGKHMLGKILEEEEVDQLHIEDALVNYIFIRTKEKEVSRT